MTSHIDALRLRKVMGRTDWHPPEPYGPDGWMMLSNPGGSSIIASCAPHEGVEWVHASIAHRDRTPTYADLVALRAAVFGDGWAYQVFAPTAEHVNIHEHALHLYGRLDGARVLPVFSGLIPGFGPTI